MANSASALPNLPASNRRPLRILVSGMIAADPHQGGATWAVLQYVLGLQRLGHEVWFVEPIAEKALRPAGGTLAESVSAAYFREVVSDFALAGRAALLLAGTEETVGLTHAELRAIAQRADVLINVSGMLEDPALLEPIRTRVYLDLDPAFIQLWHSAHGIDMRFAAHTHFVTVGRGRGAASAPRTARCRRAAASGSPRINPWSSRNGPWPNAWSTRR